MFKLRAFIFESFRDCCSHHRQYHTHSVRNPGEQRGFCRHGRHSRRRRPRRSFFCKNGKRSRDLGPPDRFGFRDPEASSKIDASRAFPSSAFHYYRLNNMINPYPATTYYHSAFGGDQRKSSSYNIFKLVKPLDTGFSMVSDPIQILNQQRFYATVRSTQTGTLSSQSENLTDLAEEWKENFHEVRLLDKDALVENFTKTIDFNEESEQLKHFETLESQGKYNEILANFQFLINQEIVPSLHIFNKTLRSVMLRRNTEESLEESLTILLNVYSTMLNKNIKPNAETYILVLSTLMNGSLTALAKLKNFNQGFQYFQVANQLFEVCDHESLQFDKSFYELYLTCFYTFGGIPDNVDQFRTFMNSKLGNDSLIYYLFFMKLFIKDTPRFSQVFEAFKSAAASDTVLAGHQFKIYQLHIENLIHNKQLDEATRMLDQILSQTKEHQSFNEIASGLISSYLQALSYIDLAKTHEIFVMFDSLPWLPDLNISSILTIMNNCLAAKDYTTLTKFWNYSIIRNDFNSLLTHNGSTDLQELILNPSFNNAAIIERIIDTSLTSENLNAVRFIKESMLKDITLSNETVLKVIDFSIKTQQPYNFITNFIINQGYKSSNWNQYLSAIIDYLPKGMHFTLTRSNFFKKCCERYKLVNDNFYGIYRNLMITWDCKDAEVAPKLRYYYTLIYNELNDLDNYYVEMPMELKDFKAMLKVKLDDY